MDVRRCKDDDNDDDDDEVIGDDDDDEAMKVEVVGVIDDDWSIRLLLSVAALEVEIWIAAVLVLLTPSNEIKSKWSVSPNLLSTIVAFSDKDDSAEIRGTVWAGVDSIISKAIKSSTLSAVIITLFLLWS